MRRLAAELRSWYSTRRDRLPDEPPERPAESETAEDLKVCIFEFCDPSLGLETCCPVPKVRYEHYGRDALWDHISMARLRFQGSKRLYAICRGASQRGKKRRTLVLHPPAHQSDAMGYDESHASRQASFHDDAHGVMHEGRRANLLELAALGAPADELRRLAHGYDIALREWPAQYHGRHYGGALDHPDKLQAEHERMAGRKWVEGPLLYTPHVVQSLGGVWKEDKGKWRTIVDATSSGVNPASVPLSVKFDMLSDGIEAMEPGCLLSGFDATDAFLNWPYSQDMSDLMGYRDARGDYHRYRFMGFGACQSPFWQQRWGGIIRKILNTHGLKYCKGAAADYSTFTCAMCYVDDFACVHTGAATDPVIAREQFESVLRVLKDIGIEEKVSKRNYPDTKLELLGFVVDTVAQTVSITEARRDKLGKLIAAELSNDASDADRRDLASLVGQLQWVAQIIPGGQLHLRRAYRARDDFTAEHVANLPLKARWARGIRVHRTRGLLADLQWWARELPLIVGKPIFLSNLAMPNGFWMGSIADTDELLDNIAPWNCLVRIQIDGFGRSNSCLK